MKTEYQFIHFVPLTDKTPAWACINTRHGEELGQIRYYPAWRRYCYFPTVQAVYSAGCLADIQDFLKQVAEARK